MPVILKRAFKPLVSNTWKNIFLETSFFFLKHLVGNGFFLIFAAELHNSITNHILKL